MWRALPEVPQAKLAVVTDRGYEAVLLLGKIHVAHRHQVSIADGPTLEPASQVPHLSRVQTSCLNQLRTDKVRQASACAHRDSC